MPNHASRLRAALYDPHIRKHGRGRILDALCVAVVIAQTEGTGVAFWPGGTGNESWSLIVNGRRYYVRRRAGGGAPREDGVLYLLDRYRRGSVVAEWRNARDVRDWFNAHA
jgi:hypothetical protein